MMEILELIDRLNQEVDHLESLLTRGSERLQPVLRLAPENPVLIQMYAYLNTTTFFATYVRQQVESTTQLLNSGPLSSQESQELGESLSELLGRVLEVKISLERFVNRWEG